MYILSPNEVWRVWNNASVTTSVTADTCASTDGHTWRVWNHDWTTGTGSYTVTAADSTTSGITLASITKTWEEWNAKYDGQHIIPDGEAIKRMREYGGEQRRKYEEDARKRREERASAEKRALELLVSALTPEQAACYQERSYFDLKCGETVYRIRKGSVRNIEVIQKGRTVKVLCAHPNGGLPVHDVVLAQKLALETDEQSFLRVANVSMV